MKSLKETYEHFELEFKKIIDYYMFSTVSFALVSTMKDEAKLFAEQPKKKKTEMSSASFSPADRKIQSVELISEWVSFKEYSDREKISLDTVEKQAKAGLLGPIHTEESTDYLIWSKERPIPEDLPFGKKEFTVIATQSGVVAEKVKTKYDALSILGRYPNLEEVVDKSGQQLLPTCVLLFWTVFEEFVKDFVVTLYYLHPEEVLKKHKKNTMTFQEVFDGSHKFTSIENLKLSILDEILKNYNRENISSLIEFIRICYLSRGTDPFSATFFIRGEKKQTKKEDIDEIRKIRNALVHDNGKIGEDERNQITMVSFKENSSTLSITNVDLDIIFMTLKTVAHNLYQLTIKQYPERSTN